MMGQAVQRATLHRGPSRTAGPAARRVKPYSGPRSTAGQAATASHGARRANQNGGPGYTAPAASHVNDKMMEIIVTFHDIHYVDYSNLLFRSF